MILFDPHNVMQLDCARQLRSQTTSYTSYRDYHEAGQGLCAKEEVLSLTEDRELSNWEGNHQ